MTRCSLVDTMLRAPRQLLRLAPNGKLPRLTLCVNAAPDAVSAHVGLGVLTTAEGLNIDRTRVREEVWTRCLGLEMVGQLRARHTAETSRGGVRCSPSPLVFVEVPLLSLNLAFNSHVVAIVSNQGGISLKPDPKKVKSDLKRLADFKTKVAAVFKQLELPVSVYAATGHDRYRKPRLGMWEELLNDYDLGPADAIDLENSFFVGDAGGRQAVPGGAAKDHSCVDRYVSRLQAYFGPCTDLNQGFCS
jgi:DNA 3'-phosphatase